MLLRRATQLLDKRYDAIPAKLVILARPNGKALIMKKGVEVERYNKSRSTFTLPPANLHDGDVIAGTYTFEGFPSWSYSTCRSQITLEFLG